MNTQWFRITLVAAASTIGGGTALAGQCDNLKGNSDLYGLCNSYCVAKQCQTPTFKGSANSCQVLRDKFFKRAGFPVPCEAQASMTIYKKQMGKLITH